MGRKDGDRGVGQLGGAGEMSGLWILLKMRQAGSEPRRASSGPGSELSMQP